MSDTPRTDAFIAEFYGPRTLSSRHRTDVELHQFARDLERENARLREALRVCDLALSKVSDGSTYGEFRKVYADALRDAGVEP